MYHGKKKNKKQMNHITNRVEEKQGHRDEPERN